MTTKTKPKFEVRREIDVSHNDGIVTFVHPAYGTGLFEEAMSQVSRAGFLRPTTSQIVSLVYSAFENEDVPESKDLIEILRTSCFWTATDNFWVPKKGVFVYDNIDGKMPYAREDFEEMLKDEDPRVRFVPFNKIKLGKQSLLQLAKNPYVIAQFGEDNAEKFVEIADKFEYKPKIFGPDSVHSEFERHTALLSGWKSDDYGLALSGDCYGDMDGCAFGVKEVKRS